MSGRPVKICRIQSRVCVGGPSHHTMLLAARMDPDRFETVLVSGGLEPGEIDRTAQARKQGIRTITVPKMRRGVHPTRDLQALARLCELIRRESPQIVHTHTAKAGALGRLAARLCGVPIVVHTFHGHVLNGYFSPAVNALCRGAERRLARLADRIIVLSEAQRRELVDIHKIAPTGKFRTIPLGLDLHRFLDTSRLRGELRRETGIGAEERLVAWIGRFAPVKDPSLFVSVCARIARAVPMPIRFAMVGDGMLRAETEAEAARQGLASRFLFLGVREDLERIYADLDLLVLTSRNEGTPVVMIEAMAAGLPVVAPAVGGVTDVARGYPLARIAKERSAAALGREAIALLLAPRPRAAGSAIADRFGAERLVRDVEDLYGELLEERGIRPAVAGRRRCVRAAA